MNSTEEIIDDLRAGKMVIIMDDEDRENEGDLLMVAEFVRPEDINFMARYGRGLICLTLTREHCQQLRLPLMVNDNQAAYSTNFTVSIEAAEGVTTGISAADRAKTVLAAVKKDAKPTDLVQPGHIFPLMAQPGGVLARSGHTEAGCDLARLAGQHASAVIVEILNEDGTMARREDLVTFAKEHNLKIGTIADLTHYRIKNEKTVECVSSCHYETGFGTFKLHAFQDQVDNKLHLALTYGDISGDEPVLVRVNARNSLGDLLNSVGEGHISLEIALKKIVEEGRGVLIMIRDQEDNQSLVDLIHQQELKDNGITTNNIATEVDPRIIGVGCQIFVELGLKKIKIFGTPMKYTGLSGFNLEVTEHIAYEG